MSQGAAPQNWPPTDRPSAGRPAYLTSLPDAAASLVLDDQPTTHQVQSAAEGVVISDGDYVEFYGEKFRLADRVGLMPMLAFANASKQGLDSEDMEGLAAMYSLIRSVVHRPPVLDEQGNRVRDVNGKPIYDESEWHRFERLAEDELAEGDDVMAFVNEAMSVMSARPRKPRELSSATSRPTSGNSRDGSRSPGTPPMADGLTRVADL